jgi:hypothetical protein
MESKKLKRVFNIKIRLFENNKIHKVDIIDDIIDSIVINNEVILAAGPFQRANTSKFFSQTILNADI